MNDIQKQIVDVYVETVGLSGVETAEAYLKDMGDDVTEEVKAAIAEAMKPQVEDKPVEVTQSEGEMQANETANAVA